MKKRISRDNGWSISLSPFCDDCLPDIAMGERKERAEGAEKGKQVSRWRGGFVSGQLFKGEKGGRWEKQENGERGDKWEKQENGERGQQRESETEIQTGRQSDKKLAVEMTDKKKIRKK